MRELIKAIFKTGSGSAVSLALGMIAMKIMAVILGPSGVGLFSLLRQTHQTAVTLSVLNGQTAIVQGVASKEGDSRAEYLATVMWILMGTSGIVGLTFALFAPQIARWVMIQDDAQTVLMIRWLSISVILGAGHSYLTSLLNGYRAIGKIALVQVINFATLAMLAYPAARLAKAGHLLALTGILTASALMAAVLSLWFVWRSGWLDLLKGKVHRFSRGASRHFFILAGTMLITGFLGTGVPLAVRALVARQSALSGAGIFDVAWTLSMAYVSLILASFSTYYLPTLSMTVDRVARTELIQRVLRLALLMMVPLVTIVISLKPLVVKLLYSNEFLPALHIMRWMLIGDYFKVTSWVFSFTMIAYADMRTFLWTEVLWSAATIGAAVLAIQKFQSVEGVGVNFVLLYAAYLAYTVYYVYRRHQLRLALSTVLRWALGLAFVIGVSVQTWNETQVHWLSAGGWIVSAFCFSWLMLNRSERQEARAFLARGSTARVDA